MNRIRYTAWDGTQRVRLSADRIFAELSEYLSCTDDVQQALDWLLRRGLEWEGARVMGLDDLVEEVRGALRDRYRQFSLRSALDELRDRLERILGLERETLRQLRGEKDSVAQKEQFLDQLPRRLSDAIERLSGYEFEDDTAREEFEDLLQELENVRDLEAFQRRYGDLFNGLHEVGYAEAIELMREMERLRRLEEELSAGKLDDLSAAEVGALLGAPAAQDLGHLRRVVAVLTEAGYLVSRQGRVRLSPRGVQKIGQLALRDIYQGLLRGRPGAHPTDHRGLLRVRPEQTKAYEYGDALHLDLVATLKKALPRRRGTPLDLRPDDFEVFEADYGTTSSTVLLLDMSWSMSWEGRFAAAKKVAMAMESLIRSRYPRDYFAIVGFFTRAVELKVRDLPEASWNMGDPFTNLQDGLRLAGDLLRHHPSINQQIIVVTDGQPTAYYSGGRLYCEWPLSFGGISMRAAQETLKEAERITRMGVTINTFMLDDSPTLRAFVQRMTRINKGRALYTRPDRLGEYLLVDYIGRRRRRV